MRRAPGRETAHLPDTVPLKLTTPAENPRQLSQHIAVTQSRFAPSFRRLLPHRTRQVDNIQLKVKIWDRYTKNEERTLAKR